MSTVQISAHHAAIRTCIAFGLLMLCGGVAAAAGDGGEVNRATLESARGWMLQFRIERNFAFAGFQNAGLSLQRGLCDHTALRLGVGASVNNTTTRVLSQSFRGSITDYQFADLDVRLRSYGLDVQWIRYAQPGGKIRPYWGVGPSGAYGRSHDSSTQVSGGGVNRADAITSTVWSAGGTAVGGGEWWPAEKVAFIFEYGMSLQYNEREQKQRSSMPPISDYRETRRLDKSWDFELASVRFGVGMHF